MLSICILICYFFENFKLGGDGSGQGGLRGT